MRPKKKKKKNATLIGRNHAHFALISQTSIVIGPGHRLTRCKSLCLYIMLSPLSHILSIPHFLTGSAGGALFWSLAFSLCVKNGGKAFYYIQLEVSLPKAMPIRGKRSLKDFGE